MHRHRGQPWLKRAMRLTRHRRIVRYEPLELLPLPAERTIAVESAWKGHELVIADILERFDIGRRRCLEFGVEFGYSTVALSAYFADVIGIDLFTGDIHTVHKGDHYAPTTASLAQFSNITLVRSDYRDWIERDDSFYDLIHVDIVHTYEDTYKCGLWSVNHATCTLFHDTESFASVKDAVADITSETGKRFYNYASHYGLGIVI